MFSSLTTNLSIYQYLLHLSLDAMCPSKSGGITKDDLKITMEKAGFKLSDEDLDDMINTADMTGDGKVTQKEFQRMLSNGTCKWPLV